MINSNKNVFLNVKMHIWLNNNKWYVIKLKVVKIKDIQYNQHQIFSYVKIHVKIVIYMY